MFNMNRRYNRSIVAPIVELIQIKHVHSSVSYQWAIYQKYDRRCHESPSGYGASRVSHHTETMAILTHIKRTLVYLTFGYSNQMVGHI